jgi:hypothetical protein
MRMTANISAVSNAVLPRAATESRREASMFPEMVMREPYQQPLSDMEMVILVGVILGVLSLALT